MNIQFVNNIVLFTSRVFHIHIYMKKIAIKCIAVVILMITKEQTLLPVPVLPPFRHPANVLRNRLQLNPHTCVSFLMIANKI